VEDGQSLQLNGIDATKEKTFYLVVETHGELYAVRWGLVREAGMLLQTEIDSSTVPPQVQRDGIGIPICYLWDLVGLTPPVEKLMEIPGVFLEEDDRRIVLIPERILWKQEAVFQELPQWLKKVPAVQGAIALGSGVAVIVLEPFANGSLCKETVCKATA
jgi:chemotaxis protein histidine kinase CheA